MTQRSGSSAGSARRWSRARAVLLLEAVVPPTAVVHPAKYADLLMLVLTGRGRERTLEEYRTLATRAGLRLERVVSLLARDGIELALA